MNHLLIIILIIITGEFLFDKYLDYLNLRKLSPELPKEAEDICDAEKYRRSQEYYKANHNFSLITSVFTFVLMIGMLLFGGFGWLDGVVRTYTTNPIWMAILFFGILGIASDIISTPFSLYHTFVIEEKFGFNKMTVKTFILDKLKGYLLAAIIGGGLLALI